MSRRTRDSNRPKNHTLFVEKLEDRRMMAGITDVPPLQDLSALENALEDIAAEVTARGPDAPHIISSVTESLDSLTPESWEVSKGSGASVSNGDLSLGGNTWVQYLGMPERMPGQTLTTELAVRVNNNDRFVWTSEAVTSYDAGPWIDINTAGDVVATEGMRTSGRRSGTNASGVFHLSETETDDGVSVVVVDPRGTEHRFERSSVALDDRKPGLYGWKDVVVEDFQVTVSSAQTLGEYHDLLLSEYETVLAGKNIEDNPADGETAQTTLEHFPVDPVGWISLFADLRVGIADLSASTPGKQGALDELDELTSDLKRAEIGTIRIDVSAVGSEQQLELWSPEDSTHMVFYLAGNEEGLTVEHPGGADGLVVGFAFGKWYRGRGDSTHVNVFLDAEQTGGRVASSPGYLYARDRLGNVRVETIASSYVPPAAPEDVALQEAFTRISEFVVSQQGVANTAEDAGLSSNREGDYQLIVEDDTTPDQHADFLSDLDPLELADLVTPLADLDASDAERLAAWNNRLEYLRLSVEKLVTEKDAVGIRLANLNQDDSAEVATLNDRLGKLEHAINELQRAQIPGAYMHVAPTGTHVDNDHVFGVRYVSDRTQTYWEVEADPVGVVFRKTVPHPAGVLDGYAEFNMRRTGAHYVNGSVTITMYADESKTEILDRFVGSYHDQTSSARGTTNGDWPTVETGKIVARPLIPRMVVVGTRGPIVTVAMQTPHDATGFHLEGGGYFNAASVSHPGGSEVVLRSFVMNADMQSGNYRLTASEQRNGRVISGITLRWDAAAKTLTPLGAAATVEAFNDSRFTEEVSTALRTMDRQAALDTIAVSFHGVRDIQQRRLYEQSAFFLPETEWDEIERRFPLGNHPDRNGIFHQLLHAWEKTLGQLLEASIEVGVNAFNGESQQAAVNFFRERYAILSSGRYIKEFESDFQMRFPTADQILRDGIRIITTENIESLHDAQSANVKRLKRESFLASKTPDPHPTSVAAEQSVEEVVFSDPAFDPLSEALTADQILQRVAERLTARMDAMSMSERAEARGRFRDGGEAESHIVEESPRLAKIRAELQVLWTLHAGTTEVLSQLISDSARINQEIEDGAQVVDISNVLANWWTEYASLAEAAIREELAGPTGIDIVKGFVVDPMRDIFDASGLLGESVKFALAIDDFTTLWAKRSAIGISGVLGAALFTGQSLQTLFIEVIDLRVNLKLYEAVSETRAWLDRINAAIAERQSEYMDLASLR